MVEPPSLRFLPPPRRVPWRDWSEFSSLASLLESPSPSSTSDPHRAGTSLLRVWEQRGASLLPAELTKQLLEAIKSCNGSAGRRDGAETQARLALGCLLQRMVNGFADANQRKEFASSVMILALKMRIPRSLVDVRHEVAHSGLPSGPSLVRAGQRALEWLQEHFWRPQLTHVALYSPPSQRLPTQDYFLSPYLSQSGAIALAMADGNCCPRCDANVHQAAAQVASISMSTAGMRLQGKLGGGKLFQHLRLVASLGNDDDSGASSHAYLCARHWLASFEGLIARQQQQRQQKSSSSYSSSLTPTATSSSTVGTKRSAAQAGFSSSSSAVVGGQNQQQQALPLKSHVLLATACTTVRIATRQSLLAISSASEPSSAASATTAGPASYQNSYYSFLPLVTLVKALPSYLSMLMQASDVESEGDEFAKESVWIRRCLAVAVVKESKAFLADELLSSNDGRDRKKLLIETALLAISTAAIAAVAGGGPAEGPAGGGATKSKGGVSVSTKRGGGGGKKGNSSAFALELGGGGVGSHPALLCAGGSASGTASASSALATAASASCCGRSSLAAVLRTALSPPYCCVAPMLVVPSVAPRRYPSLTWLDADVLGEAKSLIESLLLLFSMHNNNDSDEDDSRLPLFASEGAKACLSVLGISLPSPLPSSSSSSSSTFAPTTTTTAAAEAPPGSGMMMSLDEMEALLLEGGGDHGHHEDQAEPDKAAVPASGSSGSSGAHSPVPSLASRPALRKPRWRLGAAATTTMTVTTLPAS
jgi:trimeric autotransporter adhesin